MRADSTLLEGYIDLVFRDDNGRLVIVHYKTDAVPADGLPLRATNYKPQMDAYREALEAATEATVGTTMLFLNAAGAVARDV